MTDKRKLLSMSDFKNRREEEHDPTFSQLVQHMQDIRQKVPVNYQLKQDLKKQLFEQMLKKKKIEVHVEEKKSKIPYILAGLFLSMLIVFSVIIANMEEKLRVLESTELGPYEIIPAVSAHPVAIHPYGEWAIFEKGGSLAKLDIFGQFHDLFEEEHDGIFHTPMWDPHGSWLAVIYEEDEKQQVWIVRAITPGNRILFINQEEQITAMQWSEDGQWIEIMHGDKQLRRVHVNGIHQELLTEADEIEWQEKVEQDKLFAQVKWPREVEQKMNQASQKSIYTNKDNTTMILLLEEDEQHWLEWLRIR